MKSLFVTESLTFSKALTEAGKKIVQINGRSRRSEYWWCILVVAFLSAIVHPFFCALLSVATFPLTFRRLHDTGRSGWWWAGGFILTIAFIIYFFASSLCLLASADVAEMLSDDKLHILFSFIGSNLLFFFVVIAYRIMLIVFLCRDSDQYENRFGESPKYFEKEEQDPEDPE